MIREAECYERLEDGNVRCCLCPRLCMVKPGRTGFCRVRENRDGVLYTLIYGEFSNQVIDPIEKKSLFHFHPGTQTLSISAIGCSFVCAWCQNYSISQANVGSLVTFETQPEEVVNMAKKYGAPSISYTYNEPVIWYEFIKDTSRLTKEAGISNVLVTNGYVTIEALKGLAKDIDAVCVDIKSFSEEFYRTYCLGELSPVLDATKYIFERNIHTETTYPIIPLLNDSMDEIGRFLDWVIRELKSNVPVHFTRFYPAYKMIDRPPTPADTLMGAANLAYEKGLEYVYVENVYVEGLEDTHCPRCHDLLIGRYSLGVIKINLTENNECPNCGLKIPIIGKPKKIPSGQY